MVATRKEWQAPPQHGQSVHQNEGLIVGGTKENHSKVDKVSNVKPHDSSGRPQSSSVSITITITITIADMDLFLKAPVTMWRPKSKNKLRSRRTRCCISISASTATPKSLSYQPTEANTSITCFGRWPSDSSNGISNLALVGTQSVDDGRLRGDSDRGK